MEKNYYNMFKMDRKIDERTVCNQIQTLKWAIKLDVSSVDLWYLIHFFSGVKLKVMFGDLSFLFFFISSLILSFRMQSALNKIHFDGLNYKYVI